MYKRVYDLLWLLCWERGTQTYGETDPQKAVIYLEIWNIIQPDNPYASYALAAGYARNGKLKGALRALETALRNGFDNAELLEKDNAFSELRDSQEFKLIVDRLRVSKQFRPEQSFLKSI